MNKKRSVWLLVSALVSTIYVLYLFVYYGNLVTSTDGVLHETAVTLAIFIVPHLILTAIGAVFNWFAFATNMRALALSCGIIYIIGFLAGILYLPINLIVVPSIILSFVGFVKLKKINDLNTPKSKEEEF
ncbi:MAG: hypothetical protein K5986_01505 [Clostridium sp.]|uniref:hypothetical protein n=1 Tax=Clostridium sp. DSM 8431 TaxID=1761781 RepID=UPI0008EE35A7|nr:hypothetical protein [Clostridium sp. DSM 8431]MCR4943146.1 hypothetical protein [Clostridium sp.]SFU40522.1 hypothetical protein SAMN04487886_102011 [Clostridium sp. DSM 8431]